MAKKNVKIDPVIREKNYLNREIIEIQEKKKWGILPLNPTRTFVVDERVHWGAHEEVYIREVMEDGLYYKIESINAKFDRDKSAVNITTYKEWYELYKYKNDVGAPIFSQKEKFYISYSNATIDSLLCMVYHAGVDFDVDYQRDHVWTIEDKVLLIDSIFNNVDIGKFVLVRRDYGVDSKLYEILDGKQRLTTLCEFYEDRFPYKGFYFSQLKWQDKGKFEGHGISYGTLQNPDKKSIFEAFIMLNTGGRPMANEDVEKVRLMLKNIE